MKPLTIFVDLAMPADALELLRQGTTGHQLVISNAPASSVLAKGKKDPGLQQADIVFGQPDPDALADAPRLKWIHISSSGITRYDTPRFHEFLRARRITLSNSAHVYFEPCALHVLSFMLAQARSLPRALASRVGNGVEEWHAIRESCQPLKGQNVLIIGYGAIGRRLAELLQPLEMNLCGLRRRATGEETIPMIPMSLLPTTLAEADHVINILPDSSHTRGFFDSARLASMKKGAVFYNIGRGVTVDQEALATALKGHLRAAWLDVTEPEPLPADHPLWKQSNCFITPHTAGGHVGEAKTLVRHFLENLQRFLVGEALSDCVVARP